VRRGFKSRPLRYEGPRERAFADFAVASRSISKSDPSPAGVSLPGGGHSSREALLRDLTSRKRRGRFAIVAVLLLLLFVALAAPAYATRFTFTKVADSVRDDFNPNAFTCSSINNRGDIAFRAGRTTDGGLNSFDGIYRANADGTLTTIAEDPNRTRFGFLGNNPSMNDSGQVSFAANLAPGSDEAILRGNGRRLTTIATTKKQFDFFGFDTSINNKGEVAFKAELDNFDEGLFSGRGAGVTTHYLNSTDVSLDGHQVRFGGNDSRPSINNLRSIAFDESIQPKFRFGDLRREGRNLQDYCRARSECLRRKAGVQRFRNRGLL
jgi:hypothetical protein